MDLETLTQFLGWSAFINYAFLCLWFVLYAYAKEWMYDLHSNWFELSKERFELYHYAGMGIYKLLIVFFAFVPYCILVFML
jgi:hypothetical protein